VSNGIMGFANDPNTLVHRMAANNVIASFVFSMCFRSDGGAMTIGSPKFQLNTTAVEWAAMHNSGNW
jgi:hypothetical protein